MQVSREAEFARLTLARIREPLRPVRPGKQTSSAAAPPVPPHRDRPVGFTRMIPSRPITAVHLRVTDLARSVECDTRPLGFRVRNATAGQIDLAAAPGAPVFLTLTGAPSAPPAAPPSAAPLAGLPSAGAAPADVRWGHLHLRVTDLARSEAFDRTALGMNVTQGSSAGARFLAADGYPHHLELNP